MSEAKEIYRAILAYAEPCARLQEWQEKSELIPKGDQKTGCIGEFYAYLYLKTKYPDAKLTYGDHSEKGWDILIVMPGRSWKVQVKTVSAYSSTRVMSPIHRGWDELFVLYMGRDFKPRGFWIIADNSLVAEGEVLKGCKCRKPGDCTSGSQIIPWGEDKIDEFREFINPLIGEIGC